MPKQLAKWNPAQDAWVTETGGLFCEHLDVYSETLPKQGMTRNGILYELPMSVHRTVGSGFSSPRGPVKPGSQNWEDVPLLMTPLAAEAEKAVSGQSVAHRESGGHQAWLTNQVMDLHRKQETLLPTPAVNDMGAAYDPETWDQWTARMKQAHGNGNGHGKSLNIEALRLMSTPQARDYKGVPGDGFNNASLPRDIALLRTPCADETGGGPLHPDVAKERNQTLRLTGQVLAATGNMPAPDGSKSNTWGDYGPAIARWEALFWGPAPDPTLPTGKGGKHQLSARFVEWMMGLPPGHVTDIPIPRNAQLKALGNGVVPAQCAEGIRRALL